MKLILSLLIIYTITPDVSGTSCYYSCQCDECATGLTQQECPNDEDYCYTMKNVKGNFDRGCLDRDLARSICENHAGANCRVCSGDLCNSSGFRIAPSFLFLGVLTFAIALFYT